MFRLRLAAAKGPMLDSVRTLFPIVERITYLNTAANGLIPETGRRVLERFFREHHYLEGGSPNSERALELDDAFRVLAEVRAETAALLGCDRSGIALTFNTSHGLNLAANAIPWQAGDNVVLVRGEFPANVYPWRNLAARGVRLRMIDTADRRADAGALLGACDRRTRAVAVAALQFHDGYRPDLAELARGCRERGILTVVDGIQAVGGTALRPAELGIDFVAAGGQKWLLAPRGTGFLYVRPDLIPELRTPFLGWLAVDYGDRFDSLLQYPAELFPDARRFELGTPNVHDILMLRESLRLLNGIGIDRIEAHNLQQAARLRQGLAELPGVRVRPAGEQPGPIVAFEVLERSAAVRAQLERARVHYAFREGRFRMSFHLYNDAADVDRALTALGTALAGRSASGTRSGAVSSRPGGAHEAAD
jgi:cysteine desulfurase / selenocysteine lyase